MQHTLRKYPAAVPVFLLPLILACAFTLGAIPAANAFTGPDYRVQRGDVLRVEVYGGDTVTGAFPVGAAGIVTLPIVGAVPVAGKNLVEVRQALREKLSEIIRQPFVTVAIDEAASVRKVFVSGEVEKKGAQVLPMGASVRDVVVQAIPSGRADLGRVRVTRDTADPVELDLRGLTMPIALGAELELQWGDVVYVPKQEDFISVLGAVEKPGAMVLPQGEELRVLAALGQAGLKDDADLGVALVIRKGQEQALSIDLHALLDEGDVSQNVALTPGDVLLVQKAERISVVGMVNAPGSFVSNEEMSLTDAIVRAGGFNERSDLKGAKVYRGGEYIAVDLEALWQRGDLSGNMALQAGDTLIVPEQQPEEIVLIGPLMKGGVINIASLQNKSVMNVVFGAEPTLSADLARVQLYRGSEMTVVDLKNIGQGGDVSANVDLQPGDVVVVGDAEKVYLIGAFGKPGIYAYDVEKSLFDYITEAQLGRGFGQSTGVLVRISNDPEKKNEAIKLDMSKLKEGKLPSDIEVRPGDIIYFPPVQPSSRKTLWEYLREGLFMWGAVDDVLD